MRLTVGQQRLTNQLTNQLANQPNQPTNKQLATPLTPQPVQAVHSVCLLWLICFD